MATVQIFRRQSEKLISHPGRLLLTLVVWSAWLWLYTPTLVHLRHIFTIEDFRTNQILLVGIVGLLVYRWIESPLNDQTDEQDERGQSRLFPLLLVVGSTYLWLAVERWLAINTISATLFGIGSYGLLGLTLDSQRWRRGLPAAVLVIGTLPFGAHIETFLGYPLRIATAKLVGDMLATAGYASIGVDTILIFENGISKVDLPCSGVQSLWTGSLFFLTASWLEDKKIGFRWLLVLLLFVIMLIVANTFRVAVLVTVGEALGWHLLAEMLHVPLGVLGFVGACAVALFLLRQFVHNTKTNPSADAQTTSSSRFSQLFSFADSNLNYGFVLLVILMSTLLYVAKPISVFADEPTNLTFSDQLTLTEVPLTPEIKAWLTRDGAESADRYRFEWHSEHGTRTGSMIFVSSRSWRAHHRPERCFEVYGLDVQDNGTHLVNHMMPIRQVDLANTAGEVDYTAAYWFQSADTITDDYGSRMWSDLSAPNTRWMLVTVLFDEGYPADDPAIQEFYLEINNTVALNLTGEHTEK